jgi:Fic family protein
MRPPYTITNKALNLSLEIATILGLLEGIQSKSPQPELRKQNRIKTIQGSLSIEGNTLSVPQVTAIVENKRVIGPKKDITEVVNAIRAYEYIASYRFGNVKSMLKAHEYLTKGLVEESGVFRKGGVGILKGKEVSHVAPPAKRVPLIVGELFSYLKSDKEAHLLIKSCVFHYELMFIHPFSDGNGRVGRLWQSVILMNFHPIFEFLPIESLIKQKQKSYYSVLEQCDASGDSTLFIEFVLGLILQSLRELKDEVVVQSATPQSRLDLARHNFQGSDFSRKDYMLFHKTISSATASRDLKVGVVSQALIKIGEKARTTYRFG